MADNNNTRRTSRQQPIDNNYAHVQPQALEVERAVLGALLIDKDAYAVVCEMLYPESFYEPRNQLIFTAIRDLSMDEKPVDVLTVTEQGLPFGIWLLKYTGTAAVTVTVLSLLSRAFLNAEAETSA